MGCGWSGIWARFGSGAELSGIYTLDDMKELGKKKGWCPYFLTRQLLSYANVIVFNYQVRHTQASPPPPFLMDEGFLFYLAWYPPMRSCCLHRLRGACGVHPKMKCCLVSRPHAAVHAGPQGVWHGVP